MESYQRPCCPFSFQSHYNTRVWIPGRKYRQFRASRSTAAPVLVDSLIKILDNSGGALELKEAERLRAEAIVDELQVQGAKQEPRPLDNDLLFGNFNVAFVSTTGAPRQNGQPAGGRFQSKWGRKVFQTRRLCQSVIRPDTVTNKVEFALLGFVGGYVGLRGSIQEVCCNRDTVKVNFAPPRLALAGGIDLAIGPRSSVVLNTTYLDYRVRLGRGSRGSRFVFVRGGSCEQADMEQVGLGATTASGWFLLGGVFTAAATAARMLWSLPASPRILARAPAILCGALALVVVAAVVQDRFRQFEAKLSQISPSL